MFTIAVELGSRFLDDYIVGAKYFNIDYLTHHLVRTRCQLALARDVRKKPPEMQAFIDTCV